MFSVDNFYDFFASHYGWEEINLVPWIFVPHGSKNLNDSIVVVKNHHDDIDEEVTKFGLNQAVIFHDQESFFYNDSLYIYRNEMSDQELFLQKWRSCSWPIFCHSEKNSKDIEIIEQMGLISCYYCWHGLVSRDWFRHWKHHKGLEKKSNWQKRFLLYIRDCSGKRRYRADIKKRLYDLKDQIEADWDNTRNISSDFSATISTSDAQNTAIHLVAETLFNESKIHVTEKVFKPMVMRQPFIIFSAPGTVQYLRNYGFRTFESIWDESYDSEENPKIRMDKIINLIHELCKKSHTEFQIIMDQCQEILDYNQKYFFSDEFETILLTELHNNMQVSIKKQQYKSMIDPGGSLFFAYDSLIKNKIDLPPGLKKPVTNIITELKNHHPMRYELIKQKYQWLN